MRRLTPDLILRAYAAGAFPMAETRDSLDLAFYQPVERGVFDLSTVRLPARLRRTLRQRPYELAIDRDFSGVIAACAQVHRPTQEDTWINSEIERVFCDLHDLGHAHCLSAYDTEGNLVGGLYGLHQGSAFFGESMFATARDASKVCLVALFALLKNAKFDVVDAQMPNAHLAQFGLETWPNERFLDQLPQWLATPRDFPTSVDLALMDQFVQSSTQTS